MRVIQDGPVDRNQYNTNVQVLFGNKSEPYRSSRF